MRQNVTRSLAALALILGLASSALAGEWYVDPTGHPGGDGSASDPWDLATALNHPAGVAPGDTIWVRGGTYLGTFTAGLSGSASHPITVRAVPGERVTLDGSTSSSPTLTITGSHIRYWGLEVMNSSTDRSSRGECIWIGTQGQRDIKLINLVIHNGGQGIAAWSNSRDVEVYGCIIYHNGRQGPQRGHGHAIYTQNRDGWKRYADNIIFGGFAWGLHAYGSGSAYVRDMEIEGNVIMHSGQLASTRGGGLNLWIGTGNASRGIKLVGNHLISDRWNNDNARIGYNAISEDIEITDNVILQDVAITDWRNVTFRRNYVVNGSRIVRLEMNRLPSLPGYDWNDNEYVQINARTQLHPFDLIIGGKSNRYPFPQWRQQTGFDSSSQFYDLSSHGLNEVFIRENEFEEGRAHIVVYNDAASAHVPVDVSQVLDVGDPYELRDAQNPFAAPLLTGIYDGQPLDVPMNLSAAAQAIGGSPDPYQHSAPYIGTFLLARAGTLWEASTVSPPGNGGGGNGGGGNGGGNGGGGNGGGGNGGGGNGDGGDTGGSSDSGGCGLGAQTTVWYALPLVTLLALLVFTATLRRMRRI